MISALSWLSSTTRIGGSVSSLIVGPNSPECAQLPTTNEPTVTRRASHKPSLPALAIPGQRKGLSESTDTAVQVYLDTQRAGTAEILKTMPIRGIALLRYYSASDAQVRFGSGNLSGAIQVVTTAK